MASWDQGLRPSLHRFVEFLDTPDRVFLLGRHFGSLPQKLRVSLDGIQFAQGEFVLENPGCLSFSRAFCERLGVGLGLEDFEVIVTVAGLTTQKFLSATIAPYRGRAEMGFDGLNHSFGRPGLPTEAAAAFGSARMPGLLSDLDPWWSSAQAYPGAMVPASATAIRPPEVMAAAAAATKMTLTLSPSLAAILARPCQPVGEVGMDLDQDDLEQDLEAMGDVGAEVDLESEDDPGVEVAKSDSDYASDEDEDEDDDEDSASEAEADAKPKVPARARSASAGPATAARNATDRTPTARTASARTAWARTVSDSAISASALPQRSHRRVAMHKAAASALKVWFREHVANPYPDHEQKLKLLSDLRLTPKQLINWFTNTRKRFWYEHPTDPSQNLLLDERVEKGPKPGQAKAPTKGKTGPCVKRKAGSKGKVKAEPGVKVKTEPGVKVKTESGASVKAEPSLPFTAAASARMLEWAERNIQDPYPTDAQKMVLAEEGKVSYDQVSAWFINYRMRKWKKHAEKLGVTLLYADRSPVAPVNLAPYLATAVSPDGQRRWKSGNRSTSDKTPSPEAASAGAGSDDTPEEEAKKRAGKRSKKG
jgi:hypothetical protein